MPVQTNSTTDTPKKKRASKKRGPKQQAQPTMPKGTPPKHVETLSAFTTSFFTILGGTVKRLSRRKHSPLQVTLNGELAEYFETDTLTLAFHQAEPVQGQQLVAHGSPIFDKMLAYLDRKSAVALQQLPARHNAGEELLQAVRPTNAGIVNLRTTQIMQHLFVFHWRITYRADDKREEIYTVILDEAGERILQHQATTGDGPDAPPTFDVDTLLADAEEPPQEVDEEGQPLPPKLPPMTHLVRLAETARKYAIYHADVRCVSHEADILPRLYKTLNRLSTYYQQQIEEVYEAHDPDGEKRRALELDLERKLAEEVENHRLRVQLQLVNYAVLQMPVTVAKMTLSDGVREVELTVERNRYSGTLRRPLCHACGKEVTKVAVDRNSHITCDDCVQQCGTCQEILCADCGVEPCPACGTLNCDTCGQLCWACGERACAEHISTCPICGDAVCHACQSECGQCGVRQCRSHLRVDHVLTTKGETVLVCASCAIRCPGCEQYSAQIGTCATSGQRFCQNCLTDCSNCDRTVGPGFYELFDGQPYCLNCLQECPSCHNWTLETLACPTCGNGYCAACEQRCALCGQSHCAEHSHYFGACDHTLCHKHVARCTICQEETCPLCNDSCAICEGYHCADHTARCERCGQTYCQTCVRTTGLCSTCAGLDLDIETMDAESPGIDLRQEPCAADPRAATLAEHYRWHRAVNHRYKIYWGQNAAGHTALVVTRYDAANEQVAEEIVAIRGRGVAKARNQATTKAKPVGADQEKDPNAWMNEFQDWLRRMRRRRGR
ncbi:MAG: hypothetical protein KDE19_09910 [Caldilineaceae bacterium]|nr:hypothetical protein [Caldilineaceae bacterium]